MNCRRQDDRQSGTQQVILVADGVLLNESRYLQPDDIRSDTVQGLP